VSQTDWEDERAADLHDRALRHGEMHRGVPGEWVGNWFFPFGVKRDDRDKHYDKSSLDDQGGEHLRTQAKEAARHILRAEMALERPRGGGATSSGGSSAESEVANA